MLIPDEMSMHVLIRFPAIFATLVLFLLPVDAATVRGFLVDSSDDPIAGMEIRLDNPRRMLVSRQDGSFEFSNARPGNQTVSLHPTGKEDIPIVALTLHRDDVIQLRIPVDAPPQPVSRFRIINPHPGWETPGEEVHVAAHVDPTMSVWIQQEPAHVYTTGIVVADNQPLALGMNSVTIRAQHPDGLEINTAFSIRRTAPEPADEPMPERPLRIVQASVEPSADHLLTTGDRLSVSFRGSPNAKAWFTVGDDLVVPMTETLSAEGSRTGEYEGVLTILESDSFNKEEIEVRLEADSQITRAAARGTLSTMNPRIPLIAEVTAEEARLEVGLGEVRLGAPVIAVLPQGQRMVLSGKIGDMWRVQLSDTMIAWVDEDEVTSLPEGTHPPHDFITYVGINGEDGLDRISIPNAVRAPYKVTIRENPLTLVVDLFGMIGNTTWMVRHPTATGIRKAEWEQVEPERYQLRCELAHDRFWGYEARQAGNTLSVTLIHPPTVDPANPLAGLTIAVDAGHGGSDSGAVGLSGSTEKEVNRALADKLEAALLVQGATVVQLRVGDERITLSDRTERALNAEADMLVSIHANAAGTSRGYLRVSGASTYFHHPIYQPLSEILLDRLLGLGLESFGIVGHFNFRPLRLTQMPSVLVEQAFMTHPGDEEKLNTPAFQQNMADAIVSGLIEYLKDQRET